MAAFNGLLRPNEIFAALYNMIISQQVFADNIKGTYSSLVDKAKVDGSLYGDTKLYYATDALESYAWNDDEEAANLLQLNRPDAPKIQAIYIDNFRQIRLTVDEYLSKQAWGTEGAFGSFMAVMKGWIRDTKRIYDSTLYNAYIGTATAEGEGQNKTLTLQADVNDGLQYAEFLANLLVELKDVSREFNDYGYIRSYDEGDLMVVWNAKFYNAIKKVDLPVIFHNMDLANEFDQEVLPAKYFGTMVGDTHADFTIPAEGVQTYRTLVEIKDAASGIHLFPGEEIPEGLVVKEDETYMEAQDIAFKVIHKKSVPYMSAFEVGTSFFNPRSLTTNHYLTFGHNTIEYLKNYPFITVKVQG